MVEGRRRNPPQSPFCKGGSVDETVVSGEEMKIGEKGK